MNTIWQPVLSDAIKPKYKAVVASIREGIDSGILLQGDKLPPVRDLAWRLGITPGTVARAYTLMTESGALVAEVGRGTFVADRTPVMLKDKPIEIDVVAHGAPPLADNSVVSLFSPHLPAVGQDVLIRRILTGIAQNPPSGVMHYPNRVAARPAREAVVRWLAGTPLGAFSESDVVLSHGGQNGLQLIYQTILHGRKPTILIEELAYPGFRRAAELLRAEVVPVAMDAQGVIPEALEEAARRHEAQLFCTSPEVHNPTGGFTPLSRREALVAVARRCNFQIVEDDCYRMQVDRAPTYRMLAPERGWYVSSLAKTLTPALRIGFAIAPEEKTAALRKVAEYNCFGLATPMIDLCAGLLAHPEIDRIADDIRTRMNNYIQTAINALGGHDVTWRENVPFLWLRLPLGWRAGAFCQAAESAGIQIRSAEEFVCRDARAPHAVRIAINAGLPLERFEAATERMRDLLDNPPEQIGV
jgi:DNA-binding transcriptional MocR family regulator